MSRLRAAFAPLVAASLALLISALLLALLGADVTEAFGALFRGAVGDRLALENTIVRSIPLLLVGLGIATAFRCGIWNIGGEGQLYAGALAATAAAVGTGVALPASVALPLILLSGLAAGAAWGAVCCSPHPFQ